MWRLGVKLRYLRDLRAYKRERREKIGRKSSHALTPVQTERPEKCEVLLLPPTQVPLVALEVVDGNSVELGGDPISNVPRSKLPPV